MECRRLPPLSYYLVVVAAAGASHLLLHGALKVLWVELVERDPYGRGDAALVNLLQPVLAGDVVRVDNVKAGVAHPGFARLGLLCDERGERLGLVPVALVNNLKEMGRGGGAG